MAPRRHRAARGYRIQPPKGAVGLGPSRVVGLGGGRAALLCIHRMGWIEEEGLDYREGGR